jgi:hypothetical protein
VPRGKHNSPVRGGTPQARFPAPPHIAGEAGPAEGGFPPSQRLTRQVRYPAGLPERASGGSGGVAPPGKHSQSVPNRTLTDSPSWMRRIASASAGASEMTSSFPPRRWLGIGTVLVVTTSVTSGADSICFSASP